MSQRLNFQLGVPTHTVHSFELLVEFKKGVILNNSLTVGSFSFSLRTTSMTPSTAAACTAWAQAPANHRTASPARARRRATTNTERALAAFKWSNTLVLKKKNNKKKQTSKLFFSSQCPETTTWVTLTELSVDPMPARSVPFSRFYSVNGRIIHNTHWFWLCFSQRSDAFL